MDWLKRAFAIEKPEEFVASLEERDLADLMCREIVRRGLTTPAVMFLEMSRPLNFLGAQAMQFFKPIVTPFLPSNQYGVLLGFLERRGSVEYLCRRMEELDRECKPPGNASSSSARPENSRD